MCVWCVYGFMCVRVCVYGRSISVYMCLCVRVYICIYVCMYVSGVCVYVCVRSRVIRHEEEQWIFTTEKKCYFPLPFEKSKVLQAGTEKVKRGEREKNTGWVSGDRGRIDEERKQKEEKE